MKKFVFPDTNIFLHFRPLAELNFAKMLDCERVELVIAPIVIRELDEKKWSHSVEGIRQRAGMSLRQIEKWGEQEEPIRPGVSVLIEMSEPSEEYLVERRLNPRSQDDWLLATALTYLDSYGQENVFLLTADTGPRLRARPFGLLTLQPLDKYKLEQVRDPLKEENLQLRRQLAEYQGRSPDLRLWFTNHEETLSYQLLSQLQVPPPNKIEEMDRQVRKVRNDADRYFEALDRENQVVDLTTITMEQFTQAFGKNKVSDAQLEKYRHDVESYEPRYERYLTSWLVGQNKLRRTMKFDFVLSNLGTAAAEDILLVLKLPNKLIWYRSLPIGGVPSPPPSPEQPKPIESYRFDSGLGLIDVSNLAAHTEIPSIAEYFETFPKDPVLKENKVSWELGVCRHGGELMLESIYAHFREGAGISNFQIDYEIHEKNTPQPRKGKLLVELDEFEG